MKDGELILGNIQHSTFNAQRSVAVVALRQPGRAVPRPSENTSHHPPADTFNEPCTFGLERWMLNVS